MPLTRWLEEGWVPSQKTVIVRNVAEKMKEKYPEGFKGRVYVHFDGDERSCQRL